jgi:light-regulated signal transduction histidine kinase (bacteriophytochrome)
VIDLPDRETIVRDLAHAKEELDAFSYAVSHDLRAPLRAIEGFSQSLLDDYADKLDGRGQDYLRRVCAAAQRMAQQIDSLLAFSRVTRHELQVQTVDLSALAREVATDLARADAGRTVDVVIAPGLSAAADGRLAKMLLEQLLGNAWKFTRHVAAARVEVGAATAGDVRAFFVRDNGAGFNGAYAHKLFRPFQRLHTAAEFPGTGIGLAMVNRIVTRHGGRAWAEGAVGAGATISFTF